MCEDYRIFEIENALEILGLEKCDYCSSWDKKENFKTVKYKDPYDETHKTRRCCGNCQKEF